MKKKLQYLIFFFALAGIIQSCKKDDDNDNQVKDYALAANEWGKFNLKLVEPGIVTNIWTFSVKGSSGIATMNGVSDFQYTYTKNGVNKSTLIFDVQGEDKFVMTWKSDTNGTFKEYFNGVFGSDGSFSIIKN